MIDDHTLKYFIHEELYLVPEVGGKQEQKEIHELVIWSTELSVQDRELLSKMMSAINKNLATVIVVEGKNPRPDNYKRLLCFGVQEWLQPVIDRPLELFKIIRLENSEILASVAISELHANVEYKTRLWQCLKDMFLAQK